MSRIVLDTIGANYPTVRGIACLKFGYHNGPKSAWTAEQIDEQRRRGELLALIDVLGDSPREAAIVDWENQDVQDPVKLRWWVQERNAFRSDAVVYSNRDGMPGVISALETTGEYYQLIIADLTSSGEPPLTPPDYGLPPNVRLLGNQYAWPIKTGGPYDLSILFNDAWHQVHTPVHLIGQPIDDRGAAVEAPSVEGGDLVGVDLVPDAAAAKPAPGDGSSLFEQMGGTIVNPAPVFPVEQLAQVVLDPKGPDGAMPSAAPSTVPPFQVPPGLLLPAPGSAPPSPDPSAATAPGGDATDATPGTEPPLVPRYMAAHALPAPIDHAAVYRWIQDGEKVAGLFRGAGAGNVALRLERTLGGVLEVGRLLSELGR